MMSNALAVAIVRVAETLSAGMSCDETDACERHE
jgi:hypothetical protein